MERQGMEEILSRRLRRLECQMAQLADDLQGTMDLLWGIWIAPTWDRLSAIEARLGSWATAERAGNVFPSLEEARFRTIQAALSRTGGNKMRAARILRVNVKTIYNILARHDIRDRALA